MHDDAHILQRYPEEVARLDHLQTLVHHGGRVYGDLRPHPPRGVLERILRSSLDELCLLQGEERSSRRRQQYFPDLLTPSTLQTLEDRRVFRVYGYYAVTCREIHDPLASCDEGFFVGEGHTVACSQGADGGG
jgi:hypothetical protein